MQDATSTPSKFPMHSSICPSPRPVAGKSAGRPPVATKSNIRKAEKTVKKKVVTKMIF